MLYQQIFTETYFFHFQVFVSTIYSQFQRILDIKRDEKPKADWVMRSLPKNIVNVKRSLLCNVMRSLAFSHFALKWPCKFIITRPPLPQIPCRGVGVCVSLWTFELCHRELSYSQQEHPRWIGRRRETRLKFETSAFCLSLCLSFRLSLLLSIPIPVLSTLFWVLLHPRAYITEILLKAR